MLAFGVQAGIASAIKIVASNRILIFDLSISRGMAKIVDRMPFHFNKLIWSERYEGVKVGMEYFRR